MGKGTTVTSKGQVTIPAAVRSVLGLKARDKVVFDVDSEAGTATLRRLDRIADLYGAVTPGARPEDFSKLREEFETGVAKEAMGEV
jgi:AbrB family looped-hinge helix DNA binding protein